jgi:hypothetical protein
LLSFLQTLEPKHCTALIWLVPMHLVHTSYTTFVVKMRGCTQPHTSHRSQRCCNVFLH